MGKIEFTNHAAKQAARRGVIWRRRSFGIQNESNSQFVKHNLSVVTTLHQQKQDVLEYLATG